MTATAGRATGTMTGRSEGLSREILVLATALFAIVLSRRAGTAAGGAGPLAGAFGTTFWVAAGLIAVAVVPALLLPRARHQA